MQQASNTSRTLSLNRSAPQRESLRGRVFKWDEGSGIAHYWFVLTSEHKGKYITASITSMPSSQGTQTKRVDESCILEPRHYDKTLSFLTKKSFVNYSGMKEFTREELEIRLNAEGAGNYRAPLFMIERMAGAMILCVGASQRFINHYRGITDCNCRG